MAKIWGETRKQNNEDEIPEDLLNSIKNLENEIIIVAELSQNEVSDLLIIQSGISNKNVVIETKLIVLNLNK